MSLNIEKKIISNIKKAKEASYQMFSVTTAQKNDALKKMAKALLEHQDILMRENKKDLKAAEKMDYSKALVDRLILNEERIQGMADCLLDTAKLKDPVGDIRSEFTRPNGLKIKKISTPIGVVGIIYESRPNVTSDCIGLCLKSSNAVILKGGKEAFHSNKAIFKILKTVLKDTKIPEDSIQFLDSIDRQAVNVMLKQDDYIDMIVPRGGEGLIKFVSSHSIIPVIKHASGLCHVYVSDKAKVKMAIDICVNAKVQRPGVCNAIETLLINKSIAKEFLPQLVSALEEYHVELRGCPATRQLMASMKKATSKDWDQEYLDLILSIKMVDDLGAAVKHINYHGSHHSDAIITESKKEAELFFKSVDSACLYHNASTRFTDGYAFGFGAEVGISTDKLHARGPMALEELTTYKYIIYGKGQIR